jgi:hypothetical protein
MYKPDAASFGEQLLILVAGPPIMAGLIWLLSRGWALTVQGGTSSQTTRKRQKLEFWVVLVVLYAVGAGIFGYAWLTGR